MNVAAESMIFSDGTMGCFGRSCPQNFQVKLNRKPKVEKGEDFFGTMTCQRLRLLFGAIIQFNYKFS